MREEKRGSRVRPLRRLNVLCCGILILLGPAASEATVISEEPRVSVELVSVQGGFFLMGDRLGRGLDVERPAHPVSVSDFSIGRYEVTVGQFRAFADESGYITEVEKAGSAVDIDEAMKGFDHRRGVSWRNPGYPQEERDPVVWVTWNDASAFASWLRKKTGRPYRLPTEAEWEYAAREGASKVLWSGTSSPGEVGDHAWYSANSGGRPHPVGTRRPNALGIHDMSGNVWEWCLDWFAPYESTDVPLSDPSGPKLGKYRSLRGGSWRVGRNVIRTTYRNGYRPDYAHSSIGFRIILPGSYSPEKESSR